MVTRLDQLSEILAEYSQDRSLAESDCGAPEASDTFQFWQGASGERYVHSVFSLRDCPELPKANFMLITAHDDGTCNVLHIGETTYASSIQNRAHIRQLGAELGASEVHIHFLGSSHRSRAQVRFDLAAALDTHEDCDFTVN